LDLAVFATVFPIIFLAELPDKTALASLVMGTRYRASWVFPGVAAAFLVHVVLAVALGSLLGLLPHRILEGVVGAVFLLGAVLLLRGRHDDEDLAEARDAKGVWRVSTMAFVVVLVAEFGDLTQIVTANLAARYDDPFSVGLGAVAGLWAVGGLAILGGQGLLRIVPMRLIIRVAALIMVVLAAVSLVEAVRG
jgi:putative Ca2+/H+ antiporter (TMEM165/GDT1 family)